MIKLKLVFGIIFGINFLFLGTALTIFLNTSQNENYEMRENNKNISPKPGSNGRIIIYVNSTIYANITTEVNQYKQDIIDQGYTVKIINGTMFTTVDLLRNNLSSEYLLGLKGAILIGDFPYAWYDDITYPDPWGKYPCDLFLMDLDGLWFDSWPLTGPDGVYDDHQAPLPQDLQPEIWIARINPLPLSGINQTKELKNYFERNHEYRTGLLSRPHKGMLYIDDEWARTAWIPGWVNSFSTYSGSGRIAYCNNETTTPTNYMNNLTSDYEWVHLLCHSNESDHLFGMITGKQTNPVEGTFNTATLKTLDTQPLFYNLYACYNGNYTHKDSLGTQYLFNNNTLTVLCSSKSGGMDLYKYFYDELKIGKTIGESFVIWFNNNDVWTPTKLTQRIWHGMTILGDPLLTVSESLTASPSNDDDDNGTSKDNAIPSGNCYLAFATIMFISLIIVVRRKLNLVKK